MTDRQKVDALAAMAQLLRRHCVEMTTLAGSGHPTTCLSAADLVAALFSTRSATMSPTPITRSTTVSSFPKVMQRHCFTLSGLKRERSLLSI